MLANKLTILLRSNLKLLGVFFAIVSILFVCNYFYFETDYLWITKGGEWILKNHQIPRVDIWSYTLSDYPWIFHEWGSGVIAYLISSNVGYWAMVLLGSVMMTVAMLINSPKKFIYRYYVVYLIAAILLALPMAGFRPQQFSFLFVAIYFALYIKYFKNKTISWLIPIPIIMALWVNLHGGFFLGLAVGLYMILTKFAQRIGLFSKLGFISKPTKRDFIILTCTLVVTFLASLLNPYGIHIYREVYNTLFAISVPISEWSPTANWIIIIAYGLFVAITTIVRRKIPVEILLACYVGLASLLIQKFISLFIIISLYPFCLGLSEVSKSVRSNRLEFIANKSRKWFILMFVLILLAAIRFSLSKSWDMPVGAVEYLKTQPAPGKKMINNYGWGGYLVTNYPEQKVFIDGRMASWREKDRFLARDFLLITLGIKPNSWLFDQYGVDWAILYIQKDKKIIEGLSQSTDWQELYRDNVSVIYRKTN